MTSPFICIRVRLTNPPFEPRRDAAIWNRFRQPHFHLLRVQLQIFRVGGADDTAHVRPGRMLGSAMSFGEAGRADKRQSQAVAVAAHQEGPRGRGRGIEARPEAPGALPHAFSSARARGS